ncbi:phage tail protein [Burkholderia pseudomallei]|uniref:tail assembly protein n=1 Tax=Burkholderia pseudomallei TaxID=28450 RepID=UPI0003D952F4|nr:tail assembly protein [Burkholderia pseudomallei]AHE29547.1 bacteriophage lambda tail assembly I family protein [Burkholderia pseudomallei NCTC 13178]AIP21547.1 bacteriophage lambda tail assembly I family protein [Burkholderia pseudomallei MSHR5855]AIP38797.1 bacteriophage lambda tail assembly I family protein [Burkholderia pseudomallei MSHR5848]AIV81967.1 bacteriophage lambda tail assembly I family protein [Burkholderia pseudomallei MSHR3965]APF92392.1 phage tail protein [Burkholderia pseu
MSETLRTIRLYGTLGVRFGRIHRLAVSSTAEAVRALSVLIPGFRAFLTSSRDAGLTFAVFNGTRNLDEDELEHPVGRDEIRIAPVIVGSKRGGLFNTILGAALAAVGAVATFGFAQPWGTSLMGLGASMALGGIVQMLSPQQAGLAGAANNGTSYYFNGPVNSAAQGEPVPLVIGEMIVGSKVVSSGIYAEDQV